MGLMGILKYHLRVILLVITAILALCSFIPTYAGEPIRIVVLPGYAEDGTNVSDNPGIVEHYRRVMRFINNQLVQHGYEVINPTAVEKPPGHGEKSGRDQLAQATCRLLNQKYGTEAAYIIWLNVKVRRSPDGFCKATALLDGEGYDSAGRDLGAGLGKEFTTIRRTCDEAVKIAEKEIGYLVGRKLTAYKPR